MNHPEDKMCREFIKQMNQLIKILPIARNLIYFHIPNGGLRLKSEGGKFKEIGVLAGVSDYFIMRSVGSYNGLWLEFKADKNTITKEQAAFIMAARREGYKALVVRSVKEAVDEIINYLKGEKNVNLNKTCRGINNYW